jgi:L-alanine-DL-glutamate epimerase-like enolase superfamily enzyme
LCAATAHCPYIEFLPAPLSESRLRRELVLDELQMIDGQIPLPQRPGLGISLDPEALKKYSVQSIECKADRPIVWRSGLQRVAGAQ